MKKTDVYVVVDTPKKAKKLKKVLDMFSEELYLNEILYNFTDERRLLHYRYGNFYLATRCLIDEHKKTKVSIKELRNILAKEHLKSGDVCVFTNSLHKENGTYMIVDYKSMDLSNKDDDGDYYIEVNNSCDNEGENNNSEFIIGQFIRYATEEEKSLLEPKKELEVGKWYKSWNDSYNGYDLSYYTGTGTDYGFHSENNNWFEEQYWIKNSMTSEWKEATTQEVEQVLIEEAKRRYNTGDKLSEFENCYYGSCDLMFHNTFDEKCFEISRDGIYYLYSRSKNGYYMRLFENGIWATIIEQVNFTDSDIAIVERLHDALLDNHGYSLESKLLTDARMLANKIKSNIK